MVKLLGKKQLETMCILFKDNKEKQSTGAAPDFWKNSKSTVYPTKFFQALQPV
jgi:hypothetical protein